MTCPTPEEYQGWKNCDENARDRNLSPRASARDGEGFRIYFEAPTFHKNLSSSYLLWLFKTDLLFESQKSPFDLLPRFTVLYYLLCADCAIAKPSYARQHNTTIRVGRMNPPRVLTQQR
jgi:hypothetical protein